jgi:hypothetical protein
LKKKIILLVFVYLGTMASLCAQSGFEWGMTQKSLEPSEEQISLSLAGYGIPAEGRFSLSWKQVKAVPRAITACFYEGRLLLATAENALLEGDTLSGSDFSPLQWKLKGVSGITSGQGVIYLLSQTGISKAIVKKRKLKIQGSIPLPASGIHKIVAHQGRLYGIGAEGAWYKFRKDGHRWEKIGQAGEVRSVTSVGKYIYLLKENETLWYGQPEDASSWKQAGRENGYTWKGAVSLMAGAHNRLFAISASGHLCKAVHKTDNSLSVSSLVIRKNEKTVVLIGADVCGLHYAFTNAVKDSLKQRFGIQPEGVLINSSHTHFAPVTQEWRTWAHYYHTPDSSYLYGVVEAAIIGSVESALEKMSPGELSFIRGHTAIGKNRRPDANPDMPYDSSLDLLQITTGGHELKALLFMTGCHPVFPNKEEVAFTLSANYPGVARDILRKTPGLNNSVFLQGCGGDINPFKSDYRVTGADLAGDVIKTLKQDPTSLSGEISYQLDSLLIPVAFWSKEKILAFREQNRQPGADIYAEKNVRWADLMLEHIAKGTAPSHMPIYIQTINIGNWLLVGLSREAVTEYGLHIKKQWPGKLISVAGYCNDVSSYLPVQWHINTKVYEGYESSFWYGQPDLFPENILEIVMEKMRSIVL